uniref:Uncharacterized protein n=1 Tax=Tetraselmis chuii TaxID=63592 RepID=A0A7S1X7E5_9CHLO|mmetsp:Transcript_39707/g.71248  ORF Transcript_39707/g.71248 Transcript_39707/m.71248 type:complete len:266 (+) Transcript_39707:941-1738(+)
MAHPISVKPANLHLHSEPRNASTISPFPTRGGAQSGFRSPNPAMRGSGRVGSYAAAPSSTPQQSADHRASTAPTRGAARGLNGQLTPRRHEQAVSSVAQQLESERRGVSQTAGYFRLPTPHVLPHPEPLSAESSSTRSSKNRLPVGTKLQQRHAAAAYTAFNVLPHTTVTAGPSSTPWDPLSGGRVVRSAADAAEQLAMLNVSPHSQPFPSPYDDSSLPFDEAADDTVDPLYLGASERRDPAVARDARYSQHNRIPLAFMAAMVQ